MASAAIYSTGVAGTCMPVFSCDFLSSSSILSRINMKEFV